MDDLRIDSHKLIYHVPRVNQWLQGKDIYPIYVEIGPSGACNHRCIFCALDYLEYPKRFIDKKALMNFLSEAVRRGVKSVMYAGEGEPLLHKNIAELINYTRKIGIDVALTTNGVLFNEKLAKKCLGSLDWIRVSLDAGSSRTYAKIHRCPEQNFEKVLKNLSYAVELKKKKKYNCTVGVQFLLIPENCQETTLLAGLLQKVGVDYLIIKPYSQHPMSRHRIDKAFHYEDYLFLEEELQKFSTENFKVIFRSHTMKKLKDRKPYRHCLGLPFWAYVDSAGNVWACSAYLGNTAFLYGNLYQNSFQEIWTGKQRQKVLKTAEQTLDIKQCREVCRLDEINSYLWELKHPSAHVNFI